MQEDKLDLILSSLKSINERLDVVDDRLTNIESQNKKTERRLIRKIDEAEYTVLDEVERVHEVLETHVKDSKKHLA